MFRFEHQIYLWGLLLIPVLIALFIGLQKDRARAIERFGSWNLVQTLSNGISNFKHNLKFILVCIALVFLIVAWANPQWGTKKQKAIKKSTDVCVALDISQSMLAEDIAPNRIERAKKFTENLVQELKGERISLVLFAGNAYLQVPLTSDYAAVRSFVKSANTDIAPSQGTAIVDAIDMADKIFNKENKSHKALIIITDGENHDQEAIEKAEEAKKNGMIIFTVGVGTAQGDFIPITINGRETYKRDKTGNPVRTKLDESTLEAIANAGGGNYYNLQNSMGILTALDKKIERIEKAEFEEQAFDQHESYFQLFLAIALLFLIAELFINYRRNKRLGDLVD